MIRDQGRRVSNASSTLRGQRAGRSRASRTEQTRATAQYWFDKAREALASTRDEARASRVSFSINRCYYAAFYASSAALLRHGYRFAKHSGVQSGVHRHFVKVGLLPEEWGRFYDRLFEDRQEADYVEFAEFSAEEVEKATEKTAILLSLFEKISAAA